jgi:hypothetical protein
MEKVDCPYCNNPAAMVKGSVIYPQYPDYHQKWFYQCAPCGAYVGCHPNSQRALGRLANKELRGAKMDAHNAFDALWRKYKKFSRKDAYKWLAESLGISRSDCHIGMFDVATCRRVVEVVKAFWEQNRRNHITRLKH